MKIFGTHDEKTIRQLETCMVAENGAKGVLCADGHLGYSMPIGGVVAYKQFVSPSGVGYDIACGNMAVMTDVMASDMTMADFERIGTEIQKRVSFGIGRVNNEPIDSPVIDEIAKAEVPQQRAMLDKARAQLGTVGSGNHYVDVLKDENGHLWVAVHFGSRGFGHGTATGFMSIARGGKFEDGGGDGEMMAPPLLLDINTPSGQDYIEAMQLAGRYAYRGREAVVKKVLEIIGAESVWEVHNHHNFAWLEEHDGIAYWVVRKGATPAFPGQYGFVGGSMGDISVIISGKDGAESSQALYSTIHGAGRVMSRTQAAGKMKFIKAGWHCGNRTCQNFNLRLPIYNASTMPFKPNMEKPPCPGCGNKMHYRAKQMTRGSDGAVNFDEVKKKVQDMGIVLRGAGADEAPEVYRSLRQVLDAHDGTISIEHVLSPKIVVMAGPDVQDPYKD
jgi:tRNA-splicing ligase RtcB